MKKILICVLFPALCQGQKSDGSFGFLITAKYDRAKELFINQDTSYHLQTIKKDKTTIVVGKDYFEIDESFTEIDSFYLEGEKVYDIIYSCIQENYDKYVVINIVASNTTMFYFTLSRLVNGEGIRKEYTDFKF